MNNIEKLANVFNRLCQIEVGGYQNVTMLGSCMQTLKQVVEDMQREQLQQQAQPISDTTQD